MEHNDSLTSFVQIRGSLPFFWKQSPTLEYHVKPVIYNHMDHEKPFNSHLEKLVHNYGAQILVNLINQQKTEGELQQKYRHKRDITEPASKSLYSYTQISKESF